MLKINSLNNRSFFLLFITLIIFISISIQVEAASPKVEISTSFPSEITPGNTQQLIVEISEIGGLDWIKDGSIQISVSPPDGIHLSKSMAEFGRIDKLSSTSLSFPIKILDYAPSGQKVVYIKVQYREPDLFNIDTYSHTTSLTKTFYVKSIYGQIGVSSNPLGSNVYLDGEYKGITPITLQNVPIGSHTIKLIKSGYNDVSSAVTVSSGQTASVSKTLTQIPRASADEYVYEEPVPSRPPEPSRNPLEPYEEDAFFAIVGAILILSIFGILGIMIKMSKKPTPKPDIKLEPPYKTPVKTIEEKQSNTPIIEKQETKSLNTIKVKSAFGYKGATIQYKIKIENSTSEPMGDIKVNLYVPDVFLVSEITKTIVMLKPNEAKTVTFEIRPTGECGDCEVSGKVIYYDYSTKKTSEIDIPTKSLSIVCPMLKVKEINESEWHNIVGSLVETEENTREIDMPAETLFAMLSRIVKDMHMYSLKPEITGDQQLFNGVARFYGEGVKELKYAAQIEVVGGTKKSKLILKAWAEREDALTGFYHGILDELEKRVQVKGYIDDSIVQNFYHYGDNIGTQVKDSFVYKSNVGNGDTGTCPQCGKEKTEGELFCSGCGMKF